MASANGVIPAGNITFNPCSKDPQEHVEYTLPLEKCPDRSAQISFVQSFSVQRKIANNDPVYQGHATHTAGRDYKSSKMDLKFSSASQSGLHRY